MSRKFDAQFAEPKGGIIKGQDGNILFAEGDTVPTDATSGYAPGAIFLKRAGTGGASHYINNGTATSCAFQQVLTSATAAGTRIVFGTTALDGTNPTPITTGLTTILGAVATLNDTGGVDTGTAFVTVGYTGGTLNLYGWVVAGTASTGTESVSWIAFGL